ncbi:MAG: hypothetical protein KAR00_01235 [Candidatus Pacebacteria bacterium]|nr:hypothetical protein [Candidatus Paceibacterota bacterium]
MPPEENKTQDIVEETTVPVEPVATEPIVEPSADPIEEATEKIQPETISEVQTTAPIEQPQETAVLADEEVVEQTVSEPAPTHSSVSEEPMPISEPQPQQSQVQTQIIYKTDPNIVQRLLVKARAKIQERRRKKLDKVVALFETKPQITNKDIQKLLRISSATAVRYLDILEAENRIKQVGNTGKSVFYTKI